jgi:ligand-binding sensor domain-containing protein
MPRRIAPRLLPLPVLSFALSFGLSAQALDVLDPTRSGIPGEEMRLARWAPDGTLWAAARWPFFGEGGIGIHDRHSRTWDVLASQETPLTQFVNDVEFEADGTAWIATDTGLLRYDDGSWTAWNAANTPMAFSVIGDIALAPDGHVWVNNTSVNHAGDAIWDFDGVSTWVKHAVPQIPFAAPWTDLSEVFVDPQGIVWVANDVMSGVARYDGSSWTLFGGSVDRFDDMCADAFGNLWLMGHPVGGQYRYYRFDGAQFQSYPLDSPTVLRAAADGTIYAGSWHGVVQRTSDGGQTIETFLTGLNKVFDIAPDPASDDVWIATIGALGRFDGAGTLHEDWNTWNTGFPDHFVEYFGRDRENNFWVASGEAGISRFDGFRWRNWGNHNNGMEPYPWAGNEPMSGIFQDSTGTHWMGGNGIGRWDSATGQFHGFWNWQTNPGMGVTQFPFFAEDAAGRIFAASEYGAVYRFDTAQSLWVIEPVSPYAVLGLPGMRSDAQGDVWIAAWFDVHRWDGSSWTKIALPYADYFFDLGGINAFAIAPDGVHWYGTNEGLVRWDGAQFTRFVPGATPLTGPVVTGIDVRADGLIGIAARGEGPGNPSGIALLDGDPAVPSSWTTFLYGSSSIPHWQLGRVAFDPRGDLWVSATSQGVAIVRCGAWEESSQGALAGSFREPRLAGRGLAFGGETYGLVASGFAPSTLGLHVVGTTVADLPLLGGLLVPSPDVTIPFATDARGDTDVETVWPLGAPVGLELWLQSWAIDPAGAQGFAATNATRLSGI